jgi:uncharacterized tellurite resistance protein B-like protein
MVPHNFYIEFGKVIRAVAQADGKVQASEIKTLKNEINNRLSPLEERTDDYGNNLAASTTFAFESEEPAPPCEKAVVEFENFLKRQQVAIPPQLAQELRHLLQNVAQAHDGIEDAERAILQRVEEAIDFHKIED